MDNQNLQNSQSLRLAGITVNQIPLDWLGNRERIANQLRAAAQSKIDLAVFPELCLSGYNCEDMFYSPHTARECLKSLQALLPLTRGMVAILGMPVAKDGGVYNCAVVLGNGRILGINPKKYLPREGVHYEGRWFQAGWSGTRGTIELLGATIPFGDLRYDFAGTTLAIELCEEAWRAPNGAAGHAQWGVDIVANPSASHFAFGKYQQRVNMVTNHARAMSVFYVHTNLLGLEAGRCIYDGATLVAGPNGLLASSRRFGFADSYLTYVDVAIDTLASSRLKNKCTAPDPSQQHLVSTTGMGFCATAPAHPMPQNRHGTDEGLNKNEEFLLAESLGLFDYLRKSHARGFTVSLSGGSDSSAIVVLVSQMIHLALSELGNTDFAQRIGFKAQEGIPATPNAWCHELLTTIYQGTQNSGAVTKKAAAAVAQAVGACHYEVNIQDGVDFYTDLIGKLLGRPLDWQKDDLALQNIQARTRAPLVWLLANIKGSLLLATSNRSEIAVGYATMDGDTAGGLAPLGGIDKVFLLEWLKWAGRQCPLGQGAIQALELVIAQAPTAELRPPSESQEDEKDLMPYAVLSRIEQLFIRDLLAPEAILVSLKNDFPEQSHQDLQLFVARFLKLWTSNQWKRERYAPSFMVDEQSLDPKTWCRYPILSKPWSATPD